MLVKRAISKISENNSKMAYITHKHNVSAYINRAGIHKMPVRTANEEDPDQTASPEPF